MLLSFLNLLSYWKNRKSWARLKVSHCGYEIIGPHLAWGFKTKPVLKMYNYCASFVFITKKNSSVSNFFNVQIEKILALEKLSSQ